MDQPSGLPGLSGFREDIFISPLNPITPPGSSNSVTPDKYIIEYRPAKTFWDWLGLLVVPILLLAGGYVLNRDRKREREELQRATTQSYLDRTMDLLAKQESYKNENQTEQLRDIVKNIIQAQTMTVLPKLDGKSRGEVLMFLSLSKLIDKDKSIITLNKADLKEANLHGVDLRKTNLVGANLRKAILYSAKLTDTDLSSANLSEAILRIANLKRATLVRANLMGADLRKADLSEAKLTDANLRKANLSEARLIGAKLDGADLEGADLEGADLEGADLEGADLRKAKLDKAKLNKTINQDKALF